MMKTYAVTGATGKFGHHALEILAKLAPKDHIVALARDTDKAAKSVPEGVDVRKGDYSDKQSLVDSLEGVDKLLFVSSVPNADLPRQAQHQNVIDAAKEAGVGYIAYTSYPHLETATSPLSEDHKYTEQAIVKAGIPHSFLRNNWYLENELYPILSALQGQPFEYVAGNGRVGWAAERDYAEAAAKVMLLDYAQDVYEFAGKSLSYSDLAAIVKTVSDQPFEVHAESEDDYKQNVIKNGLDATVAEMVTSIQVLINNGDLKEESYDLTTVLGRSQTNLALVIEAYK